MRRTVVVGDVHGCIEELEELLRAVALRPTDRLVSVGDLVGKGPDGAAVVRFFRQGGHEAVRGNHDFIGYTKWLSHYGATVYEITDDNPCVELLGQRFAGFRQVPYIAGEWAGETHDLSSFVEKAFSCDPTILVTHAPPAGILDADHAEVGGYGIGSLATNLFYGQHRVTHHFFGHAHKGCGIRDEGGITFINGAGTMRLIEVG